MLITFFISIINILYQFPNIIGFNKEQAIPPVLLNYYFAIFVRKINAEKIVKSKAFSEKCRNSVGKIFYYS